MNIFPSNLPEQLDFNYIIEKVAEFCFGKNAKEKAFILKPKTSLFHIEKELAETNEVLMSLLKNDSFIPNSYPEIDKELHLLTIDNTVLTALQFHQIRNLIKFSNELIQYFSDKLDVYPFLVNKLSHLEIDKIVIQFIDEIIDKDAIVKDDASPLLFSIRKELQENRSKSDRIYRNHIQRLKKAGQLADFEESYVNGRRVLGVLAEYKREVKGIILSQSSTGSISFIEPQNVVELNNERMELEDGERKEIYRILKELTTIIKPFQHIIKDYYEIMVELDFVKAKAKLGQLLKATKPIISKNKNQTILYNAFHPVLFLQQNEKNQATIPINCSFIEDARIMVISGPNAGGKSITLKTIGLLQIMFQCGLLIPVAAKSEMCIKQSLFGDIGDNQSIEDGLSTYSSRLQKMNYFLKHTNEKTLFLIDEFGTGSDPDMGGAMAEVILNKMNETKAHGVVTTHFTNLKLLANHNEGIFNACMLFNSKTLKPLYQLHIGEPGSSFTFEVAQKIGLPIEIIEEAKQKLSKEKLQMDKLLSQLQLEKNILAKIKRDLQKQMGKTTAEKREFKQLNDKLEVTLEQSKEQKEDRQKLIDYGKKLHQLTQEWSNSKDKKPIIQKFIKLAGYEQAKKKEQEEFEKTQAFKEQRILQIKSKIEIGSLVRMLKSKEVGTIKTLKDNNRADVQFGKMIMNVGIEKLEIATTTPESKKNKK
jgi:DNA mismatch repair protein MutS2